MNTFILFRILCFFDLYVIVDVNLNLDFFVVLSEGIAHVAFELCYSEIELESAVGKEALDYGLGKRTDERALIIRDNFIEVFLYELWLKVSQVEATVVVGRKLIRDVQNHFIRVLSSHESMCQTSSNPVDLLVRRHKFIEVEGCLCVDR